MSSSNTSPAPTSQPAGKRGVIDQFEGDLATIVFDDNEQLVVARQTLPDAKTADAAAQSFSVGEAATPSIEVQADDTAASQKRVRDLLDDIFKQ